MGLLLGAALPGFCGPAFGWEDGFGGPDLDPRWEWRVPAAGPTLSLTDRPGWLRMQLPERAGGFNHWNEPTSVDNAPQLRTPAPEGAWEFEARICLQEAAAANHFQIGLVAGVRDDFLIGLGPFQGPTLSNGPKTPEVWFEPTGRSGFFRVPWEAGDVYLRLSYAGGLLRGGVSRDGKDWLPAGLFLLPSPPRFVGLWGKTFSGGAPVVFDVDDVRLKALPAPEPGGQYARVGIGGDYPTGYRGMLARLGVPHEVLLDYQLADAEVLRRFDLLLVGSVSGGIAGRAQEALMRYVQDGGTALLDGRAFPPASVVPGKADNAKDLPDIVVAGDHNPLAALLGTDTRFKAGESRFHFEPASVSALQILARYDGQVDPKGKTKSVTGYTGSPAIWALPLGRGLLVYSAPSLGATLSWGPTHDRLAEALVQCLAQGRLEPQLVPEGARFGRKQSGLTEEEAKSPACPALPPAFERVKLPLPADELPPGANRIRGKTAPEFNLGGTYRPGGGSGELLLNRRNARYLVRVAFDTTFAHLTRVEDGRTVESVSMPLDGTAEIPFLVKEQRERILLIAGARRAEIRAEGLWEGELASVGDAFSRIRYQPVEPAFLSDDFMRGEKEQGAWETVSGEWSVRAVGDPRMGANPFTYRAVQPKGAAIAVAGLPFWDDYAFEASVKPTSAGGNVGLAFRWRDPANHLLFRLRVGDSPDKAGGGLEVLRVSDGAETVLARTDGCLVKGQWYRLSLRARDGTISAAVDGREVMATEDTVFAAGKVGLWLRDGEAEFDDVAVRPVADAGGPAAAELDGAAPRFAGTLDRDTWAGTALQWRTYPSAPGFFWRRGRFWGDFRLTFACDFSGDATGAPSLALLLAADDTPAYEGYALVLRPAAPKPWHNGVVRDGSGTLELNRDGTAVASSVVTVGQNAVLELRRAGSRLVALVDGREELEWQMPESPARLSRLGFRATGFRPRISGLRLLAGNVLDTCFDHAPTDWWVGSGMWELAVRWPCTPEWSWLAGQGENRGTAALWHKQWFSGDHVLDMHVGPRTVDHGDGRPREICRAFNVVLCGDGRDVKSGYSFVVGAGKDGAGAILSRNGQVVAREPAYRIFSDAHNQWINVRAEKIGARVRLWVGDQLVLSWDDPEPLDGGRGAVWTDDNAIMLPRVTIFYTGLAPEAFPGQG